MSVGTPGEVPAPNPAAPTSGVAEPLPTAIRVQLLATEHWSLLATRSMTWSEVMSRISIHLTILSASLVVLALVVQASGFGTAFRVLSIGLASAVLVLGILTQVRVSNASVDDHALLMGMNRLRAAYVALDPTISDYLVTGWHDDMAGMMQTYIMGSRRAVPAHVLGSTSFFMTAVNSIVAGTLGALIASAAGGGPALIAVVGCAAGVGFLVVVANMSRRTFSTPHIEARFPSSTG